MYACIPAYNSGKNRRPRKNLPRLSAKQQLNKIKNKNGKTTRRKRKKKIKEKILFL